MPAVRKPRPVGARALVLLFALALPAALVACAPDQPDDAQTPVDPTPTLIDEPAPAAEVPAAALPMPVADQPALDPGWDQVPRELDGLLLGLQHPQDDGGPVRFVAAREDGTVLWHAQRPPSCTGFTLTRAGEDVIAVLTDVAPGEDELTATTASGYDLATGELRWGPVAVPGPHQGPGAVFAAPAPGAAMGETGPRVVLDPATGEVVAEEADGAGVVGEYGGVVLVAGDATLRASGAADWSVSLEDLGLGADPRALPGATAPPGTALLASPDDPHGVLIDLATGRLLARQVTGAVREPLSGTLVTAGPEEVAGHREDDAWQRELPDAQLAAAGHVLVYLRTGDQLRVLNAVTGEDAVGYETGTTDPAVPVLVTQAGAVVVRHDQRLALVPGPALP